jgi:hypothetical protein
LGAGVIFQGLSSWGTKSTAGLCLVLLFKMSVTIPVLYLPYFLAHMTYRDFFIRNFRKKKK